MANKSIFGAILMAVLVSSLAFSCFGRVDAASSIPKPSVPEFTIDLIDSSYDVSPSSTVNPYTGQTIPIDGRHVESVTIKLSIKNQQYTPFMIKQEYGGDRTVFLHNVYRWKGAFEQDWHEYSPDLNDYVSTTLENAKNMPEFSVFTFDGQIVSGDYEIRERGFYGAFPPEAKIEFQVKALIGYVSWYDSPGISGWQFTGEESGWSATKMVTLPAVSTVAATTVPSVSQPQDTLSPQNPGSFGFEGDLDWLQVATVVLLAVIAVLLALAVFYLRKRSLK